MAVEVAAYAGEEDVLADPRPELAQGRRALGVGDAVEVHQRGPVVGHRPGDRVRRRQGVGAIAPGLARHREVGPRAVVLGGLLDRVQPHQLGERLVEPQVVPPAHRHQVAEPHVGELVRDDLGAQPALAPGRPAPADEQLVGEGHHRGVLHRARVEVGDEDLVVGPPERHRPAEERLLEVQALPGDGDDLVGLEVRRERGAAPDAEVETVVVGGLAVPRTAGQGEEVRRHPLGRLEHVPAARRAGGGRVAADHPALGGVDGHRERRLEVGLVEAGEDPLRVVEEGLAVDVDRAVGGVDAAHEADPVGGGAAARHDGRDVLARLELQRQPVALLGQRRAVDVALEQLAVELEEGPAGAGPEAHRRPALEVLALVEHQVDVVRRDVEERLPARGPRRR